MDNIFLLAIGIVTVILGIYFFYREERTNLSYNDAKRILSLIEDFDLKVNQTIKTIEDKTNESIKSISDAQNTTMTNQNRPVTSSNKPLSKIKLKHKDVYDLFNRGLCSKEIAMKLNKGVGEIETIISLFNLERE